MLVDSFGRTIDYLRLSITDRCNLRCLYCMPPEGVDWMPHDDVLRYEEIFRICRILAALGIGSIRITGGEPLIRKGTADLVRELKAVKGVSRIAMTSNGVLLAENLEALASAGLDAVNISLDTLDGERFRQLTRSEGLEKVLSAVDLALELGLKTKINCVPLRGFNEADIVKLAALAKNKSVTVRFIELMPLGAAAALQPLPADETVSLIEKEFGPMEPSAANLGFGPAAYYALPGFAGHIGFISAVSHAFCGKCNRLRLAASGFLKPCLSSSLGLDLRGLVRGGASDGEIAQAVQELVEKKPAGHSFGGSREKRDHADKQMFRIGG